MLFFDFFFPPEEAQLLFRQLQKLSAKNIAVKMWEPKNQMLGTMVRAPPLSS